MKPMRWSLLIAGIVTAGCVVAVENGRVRAPDFGGDGVTAGRQAYATRCASCHGEAARGDGPVVRALRVAPPDLTLLSERSGGDFPAAYVIAVVTGAAAIDAHGSREMPVWSDRFGLLDSSGGTSAASLYARRTVEALAAYLESVQRRSAPPSSADRAEKGR